MTHDKRAVDTIRTAGVANPGRTLLALEQAGLVVVDAVRLTVLEEQAEVLSVALRDALVGDWALARHQARTDIYKGIMRRYEESREAEWVRQAKATKGAA